MFRGSDYKTRQSDVSGLRCQKGKSDEWWLEPFCTIQTFQSYFKYFTTLWKKGHLMLFSVGKLNIFKRMHKVCSTQVSHSAMTVWQWANIYNTITQTQSAKWNSDIINCVVYIYGFPTVTCQKVFVKKGLLCCFHHTEKKTNMTN